MANCEICLASNFRPTHSILQKCLNCGHIFALTNLDDNGIKSLYGSSYFHGDEYMNYEDEVDSLRANFRIRNNELKPFLKDNNGSLLDVGCAYGFYVKEAETLFSSTLGIDVANEAVFKGRDLLGVDLRAGDLLTYDFGDKKFDVITMWDTIEHLQNPRLYVEKVATLLRPNGIFAFTTGDISALTPRIRGEKWRMIHPPTHIHYFTPQTAERLLNQFNLTICSVKHRGVYRTIGNVMHNLFTIRMNLPVIPKTLKLLGVDRVNIYLNTFDIMTVIAQKK